MTDVDKTNFDNAVKEYYKLKSEYEENITKDKAKIKNNRNLSLKEKQTMIRDLKKRRPLVPHFTHLVSEKSSNFKQ